MDLRAPFREVAPGLSQGVRGLPESRNAKGICAYGCRYPSNLIAAVIVKRKTFSGSESFPQPESLSVGGLDIGFGFEIPPQPFEGFVRIPERLGGRASLGFCDKEDAICESNGVESWLG